VHFIVDGVNRGYTHFSGLNGMGSSSFTFEGFQVSERLEVIAYPWANDGEGFVVELDAVSASTTCDGESSNPQVIASLQGESCDGILIDLQGVDDGDHPSLIVEVNGAQVAAYTYQGAQTIPVTVENGDLIEVFLNGSNFPAWQLSPIDRCGGEMVWGDPPVATIVNIGCDLSYEIYVDPESFDTSTWFGNSIGLTVTLTPGIHGGGGTLIFLVEGQSTYSGSFGDPEVRYTGGYGQINMRNGESLDAFTFSDCDGYPAEGPGPDIGAIVAALIQVLIEVLESILGGTAFDLPASLNN
jgi:hypothetical protein